MGGGLWHPPGEQLQLLRQSIDERPARWRRILNKERFRGIFLESKMKTKKGKKSSDNDDAEAALAAFAAANQENALKTKPKVRALKVNVDGCSADMWDRDTSPTTATLSC